MKLRPPKVRLDGDTPFKEALFGREEFAKSLTQLLRNSSENLVIFVHAPWGEGKTTFADMWRESLKKNDKLQTIYFDAYSVDYFEDPFVSFSGEIWKFVGENLSDGQQLAERKKFKEKAVEVGKRLAGLTVQVGLKAATMGLIEKAQIEQLKELSSDIAADLSEFGAEMIKKKIESYDSEKNTLLDFKKSLTKLASMFREQHGFPLTIIVDELDRCRPDFALSLLERIKHLFDVEGMVFVLLVNRDQIESYIRSVYGDVDPRAYLLKFGNLFVELPNQKTVSTHQFEPGRKEYCERLYAHHGISANANLRTCTGMLSEHFDLTLREIERVFTVYAPYYASTTQPGDPLLVSVLAVLKIKHPTIFKAVCDDGISVKEFYAQTALDRTKGNSDFDGDWIKDTLEFFLLPNEEFEIAVKSGRFTEMQRHYRGSRKAWLRQTCVGLNRFSLLPK